MPRIAHVAAQDVYATGTDLLGARHEPQQGGLADTIRANQSGQAARRNVECHAIERNDAAVAMAHALETGDRRARAGRH